MSTLQKLLIATAGFAVIIEAIAPAGAATFYSITDLPFSPSDINDRGQIVGEHYLWSSNTLTDLSTLTGAGAGSIQANAINNNGEIGGSLTVSTANSFIGSQPSSQAFISDGTTITALGLPFACSNFCPPATAIDVNDAGQVLIRYDQSDYQPSTPSYIRNKDGTTTQVSSEPATAMSQAGQVIGSTFARARSGPGRGFLWSDESTTYLSAPGYCYFLFSCFSNPTFAKDLNDLGQVVGAGPIGSQSNSSTHALLWNPQTNQIGTDLGTLGGSLSEADGIDNAGQIVGFSKTSDRGQQHAFIWEGKMFDLNSLIDPNLGWQLTSAVKINNEGQIVGTGTLNSQQHGFLLTPTSLQGSLPLEPAPPVPVPEPTPVLSLIVGTFGIGSWLRWRN